MIDKRYLFLIILLSLNIVSASYYYNFEMEYVEGTIDIKSVGIEFSQEEDFIYNYHNESEGYYLQIVDRKDNILDKIFFSPIDFVIYDLVDNDGNFTESRLIILDELNFDIDSEYFSNGHKAIAYDPQGIELDTILLSQFAKEGFDIEEFDKIPDEEIEDLFEEKDRKELQINEEDYSIYIISLIIVLILLIIILTYSLKKK